MTDTKSTQKNNAVASGYQNPNTDLNSELKYQGKNNTTRDISQAATGNSDKFSTLEFGQLPKENFEAEYLRLIKADLAEAQANLDNLPECDRRGLTLETLRHFGCGYLPNWILTKSRAEYACGIYFKDELTREPKQLPPPSARIIIPTLSMEHFNGVATPTARGTMKKTFWKQHAGTMELFCEPSALNSELIIIVEGEADTMSIYQATSGEIAAVAILGCGNWKKTLLPKLPDLQKKKLLLLLDADTAGKKAAKKFLAELLKRGCLAVTKFLYDALSKDDQNFFGYKVDANEILRMRGNEFLKALLEKIIADSAHDFNTLADQNIFMQEQRPPLPISKNAPQTAQKAPQGGDSATIDKSVDRKQTNARTGKISAATVDTINQISPEELESHGVITRARQGYICPLCGNGSGDSGTGIEPHITDSHVGWKCFKCGEVFNNLEILARHYELDKKADFQELCKKICADFNIKAKYDQMSQDLIKDCPVNLRLPDNYLFTPSGITLVVPPKKDNDEPKYIRAAETPIIPTKIFREPQKNNFSYEIAILFRGKWRTTEIEGKALADPKAIIALADKGALLLEPKVICRFLCRVISLNPDLQEIKAYQQTGWTDDTFTTFAYPRNEDCILRRAGFDFDRDLATRGNADLWKNKFIEVLDKGGAVAHAYIGTALAAILARPLNIMNPQAHLHGTSGGGKTALQKFTASIFGNPIKLKRSFAATAKNRQLVSAAFCDLPTFYDELETIQGKTAEEQLSNDVYNFADGKGNQANRRDGTARETFEFGGARLTTGERPILKQHDLRGAYKRFIQFDIQGQLFDDDFAADLHIFSESNFGHFGAMWIQYAIDHMPDIKRKYQQFSGANNPTLRIYEPTHIKAISVALIAVEFFKVMLGIIPEFDHNAECIRYRRAIVDTLPTTSELDDTTRALDFLRDFVAGHEKFFLHEIDKPEFNNEFTQTAVECYGKIFKNGEVAFLRNSLAQILEKDGKFASAEKLINDFYDKGYLRHTAGKKTFPTFFNGKTTKMIRFNAGIISTAEQNSDTTQAAE